MKKVSEKVAEALKTLGGRVCDTGSFNGRTALGEVIDNIGELPEFAQLPVIKAYKHLFSLYGGIISSPRRELFDSEAYAANEVCAALGKPRKWFVYVVQHERPHNFILCTVVPFGYALDGVFQKIERKEKKRDDFEPPREVDLGDGIKARLDAQCHKQFERFGFCRRLEYIEVLD